MEENFTALKKYNFWEGNVPELGYYCKNYTDKIFDYTFDTSMNSSNKKDIFHDCLFPLTLGITFSNDTPDESFPINFLQRVALQNFNFLNEAIQPGLRVVCCCM